MEDISHGESMDACLHAFNYHQGRQLEHAHADGVYHTPPDGYVPGRMVPAHVDTQNGVYPHADHLSMHHWDNPQNVDGSMITDSRYLWEVSWVLGWCMV